jgi:hypothetical protein
MYVYRAAQPDGQPHSERRSSVFQGSPVEGSQGRTHDRVSYTEYEITLGLRNERPVSPFDCSKGAPNTLIVSPILSMKLLCAFVKNDPFHHLTAARGLNTVEFDRPAHLGGFRGFP